MPEFCRLASSLCQCLFLTELTDSAAYHEGGHSAKLPGKFVPHCAPVLIKAAGQISADFCGEISDRPLTWHVLVRHLVSDRPRECSGGVSFFFRLRGAGFRNARNAQTTHSTSGNSGSHNRLHLGESECQSAPLSLSRGDVLRQCCREHRAIMCLTSIQRPLRRKSCRMKLLFNATDNQFIAAVQLGVLYVE